MSNNSHALPTLAEVTAAPPGFYSTARLTCDSRERAGPPLVLKTWRELSVAFELGVQGGSRRAYRPTEPLTVQSAAVASPGSPASPASPARSREPGRAALRSAERTYVLKTLQL